MKGTGKERRRKEGDEITKGINYYLLNFDEHFTSVHSRE
jgi:hypothetical protein